MSEAASGTVGSGTTFVALTLSSNGNALTAIKGAGNGGGAGLARDCEVTAAGALASAAALTGGATGTGTHLRHR